MAERLIKQGEVYWVDLSLPNEEEKKKGIINNHKGKNFTDQITTIDKKSSGDYLGELDWITWNKLKRPCI